MKKLLIAPSLLAVTLTGCSSGGNSAISNVSPKEFGFLTWRNSPAANKLSYQK
jgi:hypothetical protein